jgi:hypothetical protein
MIWSQVVAIFTVPCNPAPNKNSTPSARFDASRRVPGVAEAIAVAGTHHANGYLGGLHFRKQHSFFNFRPPFRKAVKRTAIFIR